jgi:hypothetical protein
MHPLLETLIENLDDKNSSVLQAFNKLVSPVVHKKEVLDRLINSLLNTMAQGVNQKNMADALGGLFMSVPNKKALDILINWLSATDHIQMCSRIFQQMGINILADMGPWAANTEVINALIACINNTNYDRKIRNNAVIALGKLGQLDFSIARKVLYAWKASFLNFAESESLTSVFTNIISVLGQTRRLDASFVSLLYGLVTDFHPNRFPKNVQDDESMILSLYHLASLTVTEKVLKELVDYFKKFGDSMKNIENLKDLGLLDVSSQMGMSAWISLLRDEYDGIRKIAASVLEKLRQRDNKLAMDYQESKQASVSANLTTLYSSRFF